MPQTRQVLLALISAVVAVVGVIVVVGSPAAAPAEVAAFTAAGAGLADVLMPVMPAAAAQPPASHDSRNAVVAVSVAEIWGPHKLRAVDHPAEQAPAEIGRWLAHMTFGQRLQLDYRLATQVRYGERVVVLRHRGFLTRVLVPDQTGSRYPHGITGWIATRQLQPEPAGWDSARTVATVVATRTNLSRVVGRARRSTTLSYATTLPVLKVLAHRVVVAVPGRPRFGTLSRSAVRVHAASKPAIPPSGREVVDQARKFLGLPYLWAGMSAWGYDCSGLVSTVLSVLGIHMPRNAADQSRVGRPVQRGHLHLGDLVFFSHGRRRMAIHHVAIYAGHGRVLQSPYTGARVQITRLRGSYLNREFWGATRPVR